MMLRLYSKRRLTKTAGVFRSQAMLMLAIILAFSSCGKRNRLADTRTTYTIATLKGPSSMGMIHLIDSLNQPVGKTVKVVILNEPLQVRKMMLEGTADFAILPTTMASIIYNKGMEYQLISIPVWGSLYLLGSDTTITGWEGLRGKRIYLMEKGMTPDVLFRYLLEKNGIDPDKDVTLDYSFPTHIDLANAVAAGRADPGVLAEPQASMVMQKNKSVKQVFDLNEEWKKYLGSSMAITSFMARKSVIEGNRELVEQLITAYDKSTRWVNEYPDSAAMLIVKYNILPDLSVAIKAIPRSNLKFVRAKDIKPQIEEFLNVFYQMNPDIIGGKVPDEDFFY